MRRGERNSDSESSLICSLEPLEAYDDNHPVIIDERNEYEKQDDLSREQQESQAAVALRKNLLVDVIDRKV